MELSPYSVPAPPPDESVADAMKDLLPFPAQQIRLDDYVSGHLRCLLDAIRVEQFPVQIADTGKDEFIGRLRRYEDSAADLETIGGGRVLHDSTGWPSLAVMIMTRTGARERIVMWRVGGASSTAARSNPPLKEP